MFTIILLLGILLDVQSEEFKFREKSAQIADGWRLANKRDVQELLSRIKEAFKHHASNASSVELADGFILDGDADRPITSPPDCDCEWKLVVKGSYSCTFSLGFGISKRTKYLRLGKLSEKECIRECIKMRRTDKKYNGITTEGGELCSCVIEMYDIDNNPKEKSCYLKPTRTILKPTRTILRSTRTIPKFHDCNVIIANEQDKELLTTVRNVKIDKCYTSCMKNRQSDQTINGILATSIGCHCLKNVNGAKQGFRNCFFECGQNEFNYHEEISHGKIYIASYHECETLCAGNTACKVWSWKIEKHVKHRGARCALYGSSIPSDLKENATSISRKCIVTHEQASGKTPVLFIYVASGIGALILIILAIMAAIYLKDCRRRKKMKADDSDVTKRLTETDGKPCVSPVTVEYLESAGDHRANDQQIVYSSLGRGGGRTGERPPVKNTVYAEAKVDGINYPSPHQENTTEYDDLAKDIDKTNISDLYAKPVKKQLSKPHNNLVNKKNRPEDEAIYDEVFEGKVENEATYANVNETLYPNVENIMH